MCETLSHGRFNKDNITIYGLVYQNMNPYPHKFKIGQPQELIVC